MKMKIEYLRRYLLAGISFFAIAEDALLAKEADPVAVSSSLLGEKKETSFSIEKDWEEEFALLEDHLKKQGEGWFNTKRLQKEAARETAVYAPEDKRPADVVLKRTEALLDHLAKKSPRDERLLKARSELLTWTTRQWSNPPKNREEELVAFRDLCRIRRSLAFANPLLDFDKMVFMTRFSQRDGKGEIHMVDQFLGFNSRPEGGIYVLENPFSDKPSARPLLSGVPVKEGFEMKGKPLEKGAFLSLELSYDAKKVYFSWTQAESSIVEKEADWSGQSWTFDEVRRRPQGYHHYYWSPERVFHVYSADLTTGEIRQLTQGRDNAYDACELPDGRLAFISEKIGGNQRCGARWLASATLYSMKQDGSDMYPISYHETNEWQPSVTNDGMIAYTRWDYVDRDNSGGHHMWTCYPDGRDPRSKHSNYSLVNTHRPFMELGLRAIPGSQKFVGVATSHHGTAYGSLLLIDPTIPDDRMMSQTKRLTPEALFQESEKAPGYPHPLEQAGANPTAEHYGTPWPLSEDFHICVYARDQRNYGIYLVDSFGNRELIWKDDKVPCWDPVPFRPRVKPPVIPASTTQSADSRPKGEKQGTMGEVVILNVYDSEFPLPKGTKIKWLRVVNIFAKTNAYQNEPNIGYALESLTRGSLGLVPVEEDGSVFFKMPVGTNVYFQLLDEKKQAVHSMRSSTYVHSGERLSCIGCHEDKFTAPSNSGMNTVKALKRKPSELKPEPKGSYPVTFPRLVQPVLDKHCVSCHAEKNTKRPLDGNTFVTTKNPDGTEAKKNVPHGWSNGFHSLHGMGWGKHGGVNSHIRLNKTTYSVPGEVGAKASQLLPFLEKGHKEVKLSEEDLYRITLWMDLNSNFYGDYRETEKQARGELVMPLLGVPQELPKGLPEQ